MKYTKSFLILLTLLLLSLALFSCKKDGQDSDSGNTNTNSPSAPGEEKENLIFNTGTKVNIIVSGDEISPQTLTAFYTEVFKYVGRDNLSIYLDEIPEKSEHEIIIGKTDREISKRAYSLLNTEDYEELGDCGYVIYSDGSSLAIAYTESLNYSYLDDIILNFAKEYFSEEVIIAPGAVKKEKLNFMKSLETDDKERQDAAWQRVEEKAGKDVADALKMLYRLYTPDVVSWLANLYERRVCVCTTKDQNGNIVCQHPVDSEGNPLCYYGGFYYSNSGRNTAGYAPDIESTNQALSFLESSGMLALFGGNYANALPDWMRNDIVAFVKGLQDPDGYFYHPQWTKEMHHKNPERMGRDLSWATSMLSKLRANPYYTTPGGALTGEGKPSAVKLTSMLGTSSVSAVSKVIATSGLNAHLATPETFKTYLDSLNIKTQSYSAGSTIGAQTTTIKELDRKLAGITNGAGFDYRNKGVYSKILFDWLDENQNPENGLWDADSDYQACDGLFKIVCIYNDYGLPMNYPLEAALATIAAISSDEPVYTVCNMYNAWANIGLIKNNLRNNFPDKAAANELIATINAAITEVAPKALMITAEKTANFAIPDGSFSYLIGHSSETSTGMPTAVPFSYEGDVNATLICIGGLIGHINNALETPKVPTHGTADWYRFLNIVESNSSSIKGGSSGNRFDFEVDEIDAVPKDAIVKTSSEEGAITVKRDPLGKDDNQVLNIYHLNEPGKGDSVQFINPMSAANSNCSVFEADFLVDSEGTDNTYITQLSLGSAYYFSFRLANGMLGIWEDSSLELARSKARHLTDVELDKWFKIRIEYYKGNHETVRIKFYVNDKLIAVSANYGDSSGRKLTNGTGTPQNSFNFLYLNPLSYVNLNMYIDNILVTSVNQDYVSEAETKGLIINEDLPSEDRVTHTFEEDTLPEEFEIISGGSNVSVKDGALTFDKTSGTTKLTIQSLHRDSLANCYAFGFTVDFTDASDGDIFTFAFTEPYKYENKIVNLTQHSLRCVTENGQKYLVVMSKNGGITYTSTKIAVDDGPTNLEFVYYSTQMETLIFKDGKFVGLSNYTLDSKPQRYELGYITLTYTGKMAGTLDNIFVEARKGNYEEEISPDVDRIVYDFENGIGDGITTTGTVKDGALQLSGSNILKLPINNRVDTVFSIEMSLDVILSAANNGEYTRVCLVDKDGNTIFAIDIAYNGTELILYEVTRAGRIETYAAKHTTEKALNLKFNYYPDNKIVTVRADDKCILATSILYSDSYGDVASAEVSSHGIEIDNVYLEGLVFNYSPPTIVAENQDDDDKVRTYEYSSTGRLPTQITPTLVTANAACSIEQMIAKNNEYSKVLKFTTSQGGADYIDFITPSGTKYKSIIFETDIYFGISGYYEINVLNSSDGSMKVYRPILYTSGGKLYYYDIGVNGDGTAKAIADANTWVKFKLAIDLGDGTPESARVVTYINDNPVYDSANCVVNSSGALRINTVNRVRFYTWSAATGSLYFDNTSIKEGSCLHANIKEGKIITPPTCDTEGVIEMVCQNPDCGYTTTAKIEAQGHSLVDGDVITAPTCTEDGEYKIVCQNPGCDYETTATIPSPGHSLGEWKKDKDDPTTERIDCSKCDYYESRPINSDDYIDVGGWAPIGGKD